MNFKKYKVAYLLGLIMILAFGVRVYNFSDWLMFKADQSRDAFVIKTAVDEGIGHLPLFGPAIEKVHIERDPEGVARKSRLGPFYYYQQYSVAKVLGSTDPWVFAVGDLVLSTMAILLFYIFARIYFSVNISLIVTTLFSFSFYLIQYSRFAWNPNQLLFWALLFALGLYNAVIEKSRTKAGWWLFSAILAYAIMTQLHVVALFGFLPIGIIFWGIYRPRVHWKFWLMGIVIIGLLYTPVILGDVKNEGDNLERFTTALIKDRSKKSFKKRVKKLANRQGEISAIMTTSFHEKEWKNIESYGVVFFILSILLLIVSVVCSSVIKLLIKSSKIPRGIMNLSKKVKESIPNKSPFTVLLLIWIGVYSLIYFKVVEDLNRARYFLVIAPVIFLFVGYWLVVIEKVFKKNIARVITGVIVISLIIMNVTGLIFWYNSLNSFKKDEKIGREPKMAYHRGFITMETMRGGLDYMIVKAKNDKNNMCYANADYQYNTGMKYLSELYYPDYKVSKFKANDLYKDCSFFVVARLKNGEVEIPKDIAERFKVIGVERVGAWNIWQVDYKDEFKNEVGDRGISVLEKKDSTQNNDARAIYWKDLFN